MKAIFSRKNSASARLFLILTGILVAAVVTAQFSSLFVYKEWVSLILTATYVIATLIIVLFVIFRKDSESSDWRWLFWAAPVAGLLVMTPVVATGGLSDLAEHIFGAWLMVALLLLVAAMASPVLFFTLAIPLKTLVVGVFTLIFSKKRTLDTFFFVVLSLIVLLFVAHILLGVLAISVTGDIPIYARTLITIATILGFDTGAQINSDELLFASRATLVAATILAIGIFVLDMVDRPARLRRSQKIERRDDIKG